MIEKTKTNRTLALSWVKDYAESLSCALHNHCTVHKGKPALHMATVKARLNDLNKAVRQAVEQSETLGDKP